MIKYLISFLLITSPCLAGMGIGGFPQPGPGPGALIQGGGQITYESISSGAIATTSDTSFSIAKPSGVSSGDTLVAVIGKAYNRSFSSTGWTTVGGIDQYSQFLIKSAGGSEPSSYTFTSDGGISTTSAQGVIIRVSGTVGSSGAVNEAYNSTYDTTVNYTAPTISTNNSFVVWSGVKANAGDTKTLSSISRGTIRYNNILVNAACFAVWVATEDSVAIGSPITAAVGTMSSAGNNKYGRALWLAP